MEDVQGDFTVRIGLLLAGALDDGGFMQSGFEEVSKAAAELGIELQVIQGVALAQADLEVALRSLAESRPDLIIAHGGQNAEAVIAVAEEFPELNFAITQSDVTGPNLASYEVLQDQSAWLVGAATGLMTATNIVGHMSGIRVVPGLKGRAAYVDGVNYTNSAAQVLTNFSGDQEDVELAQQVAEAQISEGADYIFTMLNSGRPGVAKAIKDKDVRQFGNVVDWTQQEPDIFSGSAIANSGKAVYNAITDFVEGDFAPPGQSRAIGLEDPQAVDIVLAEDIPGEVVNEIGNLRERIINGEIVVSVEYDGPEFEIDR